MVSESEVKFSIGHFSFYLMHERNRWELELSLEKRWASLTGMGILGHFVVVESPLLLTLFRQVIDKLSSHSSTAMQGPCLTWTFFGMVYVPQENSSASW